MGNERATHLHHARSPNPLQQRRLERQHLAPIPQMAFPPKREKSHKPLTAMTRRNKSELQHNETNTTTRSINHSQAKSGTRDPAALKSIPPRKQRIACPQRAER